jgi:4-amino-4-deoxy-L-arabinose transferase-like glycosyltransferase
MTLEERAEASTKPESWHMAALAAIFVAGLGLRLYDLGSESIWFDELVSVSIARMEPWGILRASLGDNNPPLYYLILHYWMLFTGDSEVAIRLPSAIASALAVPVIYIIGRLLFSRTAGLISALILALSAYQVRYAQEARGYALLVFLGLASFYFLLTLLDDGKRSKLMIAGYVGSTSLLMYTHVYGILLVVAQGIYLLATRQTPRKWLLPAGLVAVLYVPGAAWLGVNVLSSEGAWNNAMFWVPEPTLSHVVDLFVLYSGFALVAGVFGLLAAFGLFDLVRSRQGSTACLLLAWLLVPIVVPFVVSHLYRPILLDRYTIAASPAFYLLIAGGIEALRGIKYSRALTASFAVAVAVVSLVATFGYFVATTNTPWREIAAYVEGHARPDDLVLFNEGSGRFMFGYYPKREGVAEEVLAVENPSFPLTWKEMREGLRPAVEGHRRVWLVRSNWGSTPRSRKVLKKVLRKMRGGVAYSEGFPVDEAYNRELATFPYQANVRLFLFAKVGDSTPEGSRKPKGE